MPHKHHVANAPLTSKMKSWGVEKGSPERLYLDKVVAQRVADYRKQNEGDSFDYSRLRGELLLEIEAASSVAAITPLALIASYIAAIEATRCHRCGMLHWRHTMGHKREIIDALLRDVPMRVRYMID